MHIKESILSITDQSMKPYAGRFHGAMLTGSGGSLRTSQIQEGYFVQSRQLMILESALLNN